MRIKMRIMTKMRNMGMIIRLIMMKMKKRMIKSLK